MRFKGIMHADDEDRHHCFNIIRHHTRDFFSGWYSKLVKAKERAIISKGQHCFFFLFMAVWFGFPDGNFVKGFVTLQPRQWPKESCLRNHLAHEAPVQSTIVCKKVGWVSFHGVSFHPGARRYENLANALTKNSCFKTRVLIKIVRIYLYIYTEMDGRMDGWMDRQIDRSIERQIDRWIDR